jgi:hypothetical protein
MAQHTPQRLSNDHHVRAAAYRVDDNLGVITQAGLIVLDWQVGGERHVAMSAQVALDEVPVPADVPSTVNKRKRAHASGPFGISDISTILAQTG